MRRIRDAGIVIGVLLAVIAGALAGPVSAQGADTPYSRLRFVNAAVDAPNLDAYVDGHLWVRGLNSVVGYNDLDPGTHTFSFREVGGAQDLASVIKTSDAGERITVAAINTRANLAALPIEDDVSAPARNAARVKVVLASPDTGPIKATLGAKTLTSGLGFALVSTPREFYDDTYDLTITDTEGSPLVTERARPIYGNRTYTLFVTGAGEAWRVVTAESSVLKPTNTSQIRFAHMAPNVGPVSAFVNNEAVPLYPGVPFARVTQHYVVGPGEYQVDVVSDLAAPGSQLAQLTAPIQEGESVLFVTHTDPATGGVGMTTFTGDLSPVPGDFARLQVIHTAAGSPPIRVERVEGSVLFESVSWLHAAARNVPAGTYNVRFVDAASGDVLMTQNGIEVAPGTLTVLVAFDDDPATPLINAVPFHTDYVPQYAQVRWAHLAMDTAAVDVYLDGELAAEGLSYGDATPYTLLEPRAYVADVYRAGADPRVATPLLSREINLRLIGTARTLYLYGAPGEVALEAAPDALRLLPRGVAQVRFIHAAQDAGVVTVWNDTTGLPQIEGLPFGYASILKTVDEGAQTFRFVRGDGSTLATAEAIPIQAGGLYTVVLGGSESAGVWETLVFAAMP